MNTADSDVNQMSMSWINLISFPSLMDQLFQYIIFLIPGQPYSWKVLHITKYLSLEKNLYLRELSDWKR